MTYADFPIRHLQADADRAQQLAQALARYGYITELTTAPVQKHLPFLVLWSPAAINDDDLLWECATAARVDSSGEPGLIFQVIGSAIASTPSIHPYFGRSFPNRQLTPIDLREWDGDTESDQLAPLIWSLPPPRSLTPAAPPHPRAENWNDAHWRWLRARRDIGGMAQHLRFKIAPVRSREDASKLRAEIAEMREIGADPAVWARFGPRTAAAAAEGPAALRAWAEKIDETCTMPDADAPDEMRTISDIAKLQFAIQICVGINKRLTFTQDIRTDEEVLALIEAGDSETIAKHRYDSALMQKARPAIERLARENHAEAINLLADLPGTPHYRYRVLKEKAAKLGSTDAIGALIRDLEFKRKYRDTIPLLRRAAELGDENCKRDLAQALDAGKHVKRDARTAFALYNEMQTKEGWRDTQLALRIAQMQWDGDGCPRDRDAALHAFFDLHIGDEAPYAAAVFIGDLYRDGLHGIAKDRDEAVAWYRDALTYGGIEAAAARKRLKDMKVKLTEEDGEDDEFDEEEREKLSNFWRVRA